MRTFRIIEGDSLEALKAMPDASVDACVTDPPYDLTAVSRKGSPRVQGTGPFGRHKLDTKGFMGKAWDGTGIAFNPETWAEVYRTLKDGSRLLAFGGTRTYHRMACAIEDAGFLIEDSVQFFFEVSGVARELWESLTDEQRKALAHILAALDPDGNLFWLYGSGFPKHKSKLKPAYEPIVVARKGGASHLNIDACRIETTEDLNGGAYSGGISKGGVYQINVDANVRRNPEDFKQPSGRWPANVIMDEEAAAALDEQTGTLTSGRCPEGFKGEFKANVYGAYANNLIRPETVYGDSGGASRFFYCAKADSSERGTGNTHPTVKPLSLMCWLVRLITPEGGTVLDPFTGSGSTGIAALREGFNFIGIERESEYVEIARRRIIGDAPLINREAA